MFQLLTLRGCWRTRTASQTSWTFLEGSALEWFTVFLARQSLLKVLQWFCCTCPPGGEGSLPPCTFPWAILRIHPGRGGYFYSSTMSCTTTSAIFRHKCWMAPYFQYITAVGKQLACRGAGCRLADGLPTKEINERRCWGWCVRNGLGESGSPLVCAAPLRSLGRL